MKKSRDSKLSENDSIKAEIKAVEVKKEKNLPGQRCEEWEEKKADLTGEDSTSCHGQELHFKLEKKSFQWDKKITISKVQSIQSCATNPVRVMIMSSWMHVI